MAIFDIRDYASPQAAVDAASVAGGDVLIPQGITNLVETLTIRARNVRLVGEGSARSWSSLPLPGSVLRWAGDPGGVMVRLASPEGAEYTIINGVGLEHLTFDCNDRAGKALEIRSITGSEFHDLYIRRPLTVGMDLHVNQTQSTFTSNHSNRFSMIQIWCMSGASENADGIWLDGDADFIKPGNTCISVYDQILIWHGNGAGLRCRNSDGSEFRHIACNRAATATGIGIELCGAPRHAREQLFVFMQTGRGGLVARAGSGPNRVLAYSLGNWSPLPIVETGAKLVVDFIDGRRMVNGVF